jgi:uncharacterized membrane protein (UPF0127 family)
MRNVFTVFLLTVILTITGCGDGSTTANPTTRAAGPMTVSMKIGSKTYTLEVAADEVSREVGLMNRDHMAADHGMIFVFPDADDRGFWMKNTLIPLDIVFVDASGKVVSVHTMKPLDESTTPSDGPAKYAVELCAGEAAADGIKPGDQVKIPPDADTALARETPRNR